VIKQRNGDYQVPSGCMWKSFLCMTMITFVSDASPWNTILWYYCWRLCIEYSVSVCQYVCTCGAWWRDL